VVLKRSELGARSLETWLLAGDAPSIRESLELGVALCEILGYLNGIGIPVLDLSLSWIAHEVSAGLRFVQLMDPTAVVPAPGVLPEARDGASDGLGEPDAPEPSQVFLVGAVVLAAFCGTAEVLQAGDISPGRSASFAHLAGYPDRADDRAERIAEPLATDLERRTAAGRDRVEVRRAVEVLRWSLAESRDARYRTLAELSAGLRGAAL
jgi:hypothetical protein